jgi:hypothetical protein
MIFEMRFQIWVLAISLAVSTLAGYAVAVPETSSWARTDRSASIGDGSQWSATIFTEFGNEMAWADKASAEPCVRLKSDANGDGLLKRLTYRVSQTSQDRSAATPMACQVPQSQP